MTPQVYLRKGKEESLMRRHPWIFSGAIDHIKAEDESEITEGALVEIYTRTGDFIALGHYQIGSIAVRVLTFDKEPIDQAWWNRRIAVAYDVRRTLGLTDNPDTDCYRLVHGEGDGLPGLVVDIYGTVAVVQCHSVGMYLARQDIARAILAAYGDRITAIYDKSSQTVPFNARLGAVDGYLWGSSDHSAHVVTENGEKFLVNWEQGQKTGFFLDQRENRELVKRYSKGRTVLNTFCYTGGFSVYAMAGGRREGLLGGLFGTRRRAGHGKHETQLRPAGQLYGNGRRCRGVPQEHRRQIRPDHPRPTGLRQAPQGAG